MICLLTRLTITLHFQLPEQQPHDSNSGRSVPASARTGVAGTARQPAAECRLEGICFDAPLAETVRFVPSFITSTCSVMSNGITCCR